MAGPSRAVKTTAYSITTVLVLLTILFIELYAKSYISSTSLEVAASVTFSLFLTSVVFSWMIYKGSTPRQIIDYLGLSRSKLTPKAIGIGVLLFVVVILFGLVLGVFTAVTNIQLPTNVQQVLAGTPLYFLVFTFLIAPINEEIFFRGFLVSKISKWFGAAAGIIISAIIFSVLHLSYLSISEFAAAFFFGLIAGYVFSKTKSLYPSIVAHMLVNFTTVISLIYVGSLFIHP